MSAAAKRILADQEASFDVVHDQPAMAAALHGGVDARELQTILAQAYTETSADEKLPIGQRVAIIVGASSFLWALIGAGLYRLL